MAGSGVREATYGSIPPHSGAGPTERRRLNRLRILLGVTAVTCLTAVVVIVTIVASPATKPSLLSTSNGLDIPPSQMLSFDTATIEDARHFEADANRVLEHIGISGAQVNTKTDLPAACGVALDPCVATVGDCLVSRTNIDPSTGRISVRTNGCQCFSRGIMTKIPVPDRPNIAFRCPYMCLQSISNLFEQHIEAVNGDERHSAASLQCPRTFKEIALSVYGGDHGELTEETVPDELVVQPISDKRVLRASKAVQDHLIDVRRDECPHATPSIDGRPKVLYAERGTVSDGKGLYRLELELGGAIMYTARIAHLPPEAQLEAPDKAEEDPDNLLGRFALLSISPDPCAHGPDSQLAVTASTVNAINGQQLSWKAKYTPEHHEGVTRARFGLGYIRPTKAQADAHSVMLPVDGFEPPASYDARDHRAHEPPCRAFEVMDQQACGSCYAFAAGSALSARFCAATQRRWNVVLSPQEMMDCAYGCRGGWSLQNYQYVSSANGRAVQDFCDPYQAWAATCGGYCAEGVTFHGMADTAHIVGRVGGNAVLQMQKELLTNGPGVVGFELFDDLYAYHEGVYTKSPYARSVGWHAVTLVGWGTEKGVDYWLIQNSWGDKVGDHGYWKIRRGTDECSIESEGLTVVKPMVPTVCAATTCVHGAPLADCSCKCHQGWTGRECATNALTCLNGGVLSDDESECWCPIGTRGVECEATATFSSRAQLSSNPSPLTIDFFFQGSAPPPTQRSFVAVYTAGATNSMDYVGTRQMRYVCGNGYDYWTDGGLCPSSLSVEVDLPARVGDFKVYLVEYQPPNEFGMDGYPRRLKQTNLLGSVSVVPDEAARAAKDTANDPLHALTVHVAALRREAALLQQAMDARLDAAAAALGQDEAPPSPAPAPP
eukprot:CAMPEP_0181316836 /NCGR_PEP_ID=MMETSP1101-20121128/16107_1 /TAXON_ID=46948 /ORGANISM="Rhodomonas abbreviata, Strain Caron Lab Isolate" /LENGTH=889 /DNA_ID=CAMNT_0023424109 /DNA_START=5 /DNA_END=2670 /DNA_ORIENTATION=-